MKLLLTQISLLMSVGLAQASTLTNGQYQGHGGWKAEDGTGSYQVKTNITDDEIETQYELADKSTKNWVFRMKESQNKFFTVETNGLKIGQGYCLDQAQVCHYEIKINDFSLEETIVNLEGKLYKYGSKVVNGKTVRWQEALEKLAEKQ